MASTVELYLSGAWVDVTTPYVWNQQRVEITRLSGWLGQDSKVQPSSCAFTLLNQGSPGPFSYQTPGSTYYGVLGLGTQVRVMRGSSTRFLGEISRLTPGADPGARLAWVEVECAGALGRWTVGNQPVASPLYRSITGSSELVAYWPLEDMAGTADAAVGWSRTQARSRRTQRAEIGGDFGFGLDSDLPGGGDAAQPEPGSSLVGEVQTRAYPSDYSLTADRWTVAWAMRIPAQPTGTLTPIQWQANGDVTRYEVTLSPASLLNVRGYNAAGGEVLGSAGVTYPSSRYGDWCLFSVTSADSGANSTVTLTSTRVDSGLAISTTGTLTGADAPQPRGRITVTGSSEDSPYSIGHLCVFATGTSALDVDAAGGYVGEIGRTRIDRVCTELGITASIRGSQSTGNGTLGPQPKGTLQDILQDAADADGGMVFDAKTLRGVGYITRMSLYNQLPSLELDYASGQIHEGLSLDGSDLLQRNDVTASRASGSSARVAIEDGDFWHDTTEDPPDGVGTYPGSVSVNVEFNSRVNDHAGWYAHLGSAKEPRLGELLLKLHAPVFRDNSALLSDALGLNIGDTIKITNQPDWLPPDPIELLIYGYSEVIDADIHELRLRTAPARPWEVWPVDTGGSQIEVAVDTDDTSLTVSTSLGPEWSTTTEPYHISIGGEAMTVTTMVTNTPTFVAAGTVAHADNTSVTPGMPAGVAAPDLMILVAAIRNSGTGTVNTPSGWTRISGTANLATFGRHYVAGDTAPTVTFADGVAGATCSARIVAFTGLSMEFGGVSKASPTYAAQLNGSADPIAYPAHTSYRAGVSFIAGWKQDDHTGVSAVAGFAEAFDSFTATGDDQSLFLQYRIDASATSTAAGSVTASGGVSAISRAHAFSLRPTQTATVTRGVNGVSLSHARGADIHAWRLGAVAQ